MSQPIQRDGVWWHQKADGTWLRWNAQKSEWETAPAAPPPPTPPQENGPAIPAATDPEANDVEPAFGFSTADSVDPGLPEGPEEVKWEFGDEGGETISLGPANADLLPPESDKPSASDWLNANRAVAALVAVLVLAAAAFAAFTFLGGGDDPADDGTPGTTIDDPASKKAAVRKLNALCTSADRRMKALGTPTTPDEFVGYLDKARNEFKGFVRDLNQIRPLPEDKAAFGRIVKDFKKSLRYTDEALAAAQAGNMTGLQQTLVKFDGFSTKMRGRARAFGAHACATT